MKMLGSAGPSPGQGVVFVMASSVLVSLPTLLLKPANLFLKGTAEKGKCLFPLSEMSPLSRKVRGEREWKGFLQGSPP